MKLPLLILGTFFFCIIELGQMPVAYADELSERAEIHSQFATLFLQDRFDELNSMSEKFRTSQERTPSGTWKLASFYAGEETLFSGAKTDKDWDAITETATSWVQKKPSIAAYNVLIDSFHIRACRNHQQPFLKIAHDTVNMYRAQASEDPEFYRTQISMAECEGIPPEDALKLFSEATSKHKYYYDLYFQIARYLLIRHAPTNLLNDFVNNAVSNTKEKDGTGIYARIYWYTSGIGVSTAPDTFKTPLTDWSKMDNAINDVLKSYPDQWNINNFAYLACMAKDKNMTKALMDKIKDIILPAWQNISVYQDCQTWASTSSQK